MAELRSDFKLKKDIIKSALSDEPWDLLKSDVFEKKSYKGTTLVEGPISWTIFHRNSNLMEILFCCHPSYNKVIAMKFCIWHHSWAVMACTGCPAHRSARKIGKKDFFIRKNRRKIGKYYRKKGGKQEHSCLIWNSKLLSYDGLPSPLQLSQSPPFYLKKNNYKE